MGYTGLAVLVVFLACLGLASLVVAGIAFVREVRTHERERRRYIQLERIRENDGVMP
ncbi:MAG TPA: hypothetical protein PKA51_09315 [Kiritimatiellia bacterium]|nr:hypothetical protein [Kiritimatiellia bacterium]